MSDETKRKLREANLGKKYSEESKDKRSKALIGHSVTEETREKIRKTLTGTKRPSEVVEKMSKSINERNKKIFGEGHNPTNRLRTYEWKKVRNEVYKRDNYTCQVCGIECVGFEHEEKFRRIQCHHIVPYRITQDNSASNLITLCVKCHVKEERKYYKTIGENK